MSLKTQGGGKRKFKHCPKVRDFFLHDGMTSLMCKEFHQVRVKFYNANIFPESTWYKMSIFEKFRKWPKWPWRTSGGPEGVQDSKGGLFFFFICMIQCQNFSRDFYVPITSKQAYFCWLRIFAVIKPVSLLSQTSWCPWCRIETCSSCYCS